MKENNIQKSKSISEEVFEKIEKESTEWNLKWESANEAEREKMIRSRLDQTLARQKEADGKKEKESSIKQELVSRELTDHQKGWVVVAKILAFGLLVWFIWQVAKPTHNTIDLNAPIDPATERLEDICPNGYPC